MGSLLKTVNSYNLYEGYESYLDDWRPGRIVKNDDKTTFNCDHVLYTEPFEHQNYKNKMVSVDSPVWYNKNRTDIVWRLSEDGEPMKLYRNKFIDGTEAITDDPLLGE